MNYLTPNPMNPQTKTQIKTALEAQAKRKYPNMRDHTRPKIVIQENSANALTKSVIAYLQAEGWQAERISTTGRWIADKSINAGVFKSGATTSGGKYIKGSGTKGSADISATIKGRSVKIEIKYGRDRQSEYQKAYQVNIEQAGGVYWLVRDLDSFLEMYNNFIQSL